MKNNSKEAFKEVEKFERWMTNRVKTVHYADDKRMSEAYERVYNNALNNGKVQSQR